MAAASDLLRVTMSISRLQVPLHFEGWTHFSESRAEIDRAFAAAGLADRLGWPIAGQAMELSGT